MAENTVNVAGVRLRRLVTSAMFLGIALMIRTYFTIYIPMLGGTSRVGVVGIFSIPPSILFGPFFGGMVTGLLDLIGFMLRPSGPFLYQMTLVALTAGFLRGCLWMYFKNKSIKVLRIILGFFTLFTFTFAILSIISVMRDNLSADFFNDVTSLYEHEIGHLSIISRFLVERSAGAANPGNFLTERIFDFTTLPLLIGSVSLVILFVDIIFAKKIFKEKSEWLPASILPLLITIVLTAVYINTLNTVILREVAVPAWRELPFFFIWLPRVIPAILNAVVESVFVAILLQVAFRQKFIQRIAFTQNLGQFRAATVKWIKSRVK